MKEWPLAALALAIAIGAAAAILLGGEPPKPTASAATSVSSPEGQRVVVGADADGPRAMTPRKTPEEKTRDTIASHEARVQAEPDAPEAPALLCAMGNLYRQKLGDYEKAAEAYSLLLAKYPNWEGLQRVYLNLAICYEKLGRTDDENWVYEQMMEHFPEDSQEYLFAKSKLYGGS